MLRWLDGGGLWSHQHNQLTVDLRGCFPASQEWTHQTMFSSSLPVLNWFFKKRISICSPIPPMVTESNPLSSGENGSFLTQWTSKKAGIPGYGLFCDALLEKPVNVIPPLAPVKSQRKQEVCSNCGLQEHPITSWTNTVICIGTRTRSHYRSAASSLDMFFILAVVERKSFISLGKTSASWLSYRLPQLWKHNLQWKHLSYKINKSSNPSIKSRDSRKPRAKAIEVPLGFKGSSCHILKKAKDSWETRMFTKTLPPTGPAVYSRSPTSHTHRERETQNIETRASHSKP